MLIDAHMLGSQEGGNESYVAGLLGGLGESSRMGDSDCVVALVEANYVEPHGYRSRSVRQPSGQRRCPSSVRGCAEPGSIYGYRRDTRHVRGIFPFYHVRSSCLFMTSLIACILAISPCGPAFCLTLSYR